MKKGVIIGTVVGIFVGVTAVWVMNSRKIAKLEGKVVKFKTYYNMLNDWLSLKQEGSTLAKHFEESGYKEIAIYGMGELGQRLYEELKNTNITVKYAIDKNADYIYSDLELKKPGEDLDFVDAVVVTAAFDFDKIESELAGFINGQIVSLEEFI